MLWFVVAYNLTGQIVAVGTPYVYDTPPLPQTEEICLDRREHYDLGKYTLVCEQHKKAPKITGKMDRDLHSSMQNQCSGFGTACEKIKWRDQHPGEK